MKLILFQPDIPQNTGALLRLAACFGASVDIIGPLGYILDDQRLRRSGMDYIDQVEWKLHTSWGSFLAQNTARLIVLTTKASQIYYEHAFQPEDGLILGRESAGLPEEVHQRADIRLRIPIQKTARSLNVSQAGAIVLAEAQRQLELLKNPRD